MARPHRRALAFLGFWVRQLLAAHRKSARWSISLHYQIASLQGWIAWIGVDELSAAHNVTQKQLGQREARPASCLPYRRA